MSERYPEDDSDLRTIVRAETGYEDNVDEFPQSDLDTIIEQSKGRVELKTGSDKWYSDNGLGFSLAGYAKMRAKAAMENVPLSSYTLGAEQVSFNEADPETSQQLQEWAEDVRVGLDASSVDDDTGKMPSNTAGYIGETSLRE